MANACTHLVCELIGGDCSIAISRSRGCRPGRSTKLVSEVFDEVRALLGVIDPSVRTEDGHTAAVRLAQIVRAEALEGRDLLTRAREDDPDLAELLAPLVMRRVRKLSRPPES